MSGCSSGVEHNLAKVGVEGSNPFARSKFSQREIQDDTKQPRAAFVVSGLSKKNATGKTDGAANHLTFATFRPQLFENT